MRTLIFSSPSSSSGKTITSLCVEAGLINLGKKLTSFKFGPDFIDPSYHRLFSECYNLDPVMSSPEFVKYLFSHKCSDYNVVEGAMGLFDGELSGGSTYKLSKILGAKIVLCVDVSAMGESIRAIAKGFKKYISGIVAVKVGSQHHLQIIKNSLEKENIKLLGYIPKSKELEIPSRHLGLILSDEIGIKKSELERIFFKCFEVKEILNLFESSYAKIGRVEEIEEGKKNVKVAIFSDRVFPFVYPENIFVLEKLGFDVVKITTKDKKGKFDVLIIPGGYPELFPEEIDMKALKELIKIPKYVIAECGGLEILSKNITFRGKKIKGLSIFPFEIEITEKIQALGWRTLKTKKLTFKGHEFHYGKISNIKPNGVFLKFDSRGNNLGTDGFLKGKFLAFWTHIYFGSNPKKAKELIMMNIR